MSYKPGTALWYALLIWLVGFIWGTVVFMAPSLMAIPSIPYFSKYPAISFPITTAYVFLIYFLSRRYLADAVDRVGEGLRFGATLFAVNLVLDALVYYGAFGSGDYFSYLSIWFSYGMFILIPGYAARRMG
jgi:hypothetical protein